MQWAPGETGLSTLNMKQWFFHLLCETNTYQFYVPLSFSNIKALQSKAEAISKVKGLADCLKTELATILILEFKNDNIFLFPEHKCLKCHLFQIVKRKYFFPHD